MQQNEPLIDILDESGIRTGTSLSRAEIHRKGKIHRAVRLYLFDKSNNILLQRRSASTDHYSEMWSVSLAGHVDAGESSGTALDREIREELGLDPNLMKIKFLFSFRKDATIGTYIDRQFIDVYAARHDFRVTDIDFDRESITDVKVVPFNEFQEMVRGKNSHLGEVYGRDCSEVADLFIKCKG